MPKLAKLIAVGWGSKGYYSESLLREYGATAFPAGTKMFINHPKVQRGVDGAVLAESVERDWRDLAGVTTTDAFFVDDHAEGAGLYAWTEQFAPKKDEIIAKAKHSGLSIFVPGTYVIGEAEGRQGRLVQTLEASPINTVDFVAQEGAGGKLLLTESALPILDESFQLTDDEQEKPHKGIFMEGVPTDIFAEGHNAGEWLESRFHLRMTELADNMFADGNVNHEERIAISSALGQGLTAFRQTLLAQAPHVFNRERWQSAPPSADLIDVISESLDVTIKEIGNMADQDLQAQVVALQRANAELTRELNETRVLWQESRSQADKLREQLILRDARDFAMGQLAKSDLPVPTKKRLLRESLRTPPIENGQLAKATFQEQINTAIHEATAELRAIFDENNGSVWGMGDDSDLLLTEGYGQQQVTQSASEEDELMTIFKEMGFTDAGLRAATQ